MGFFRGVSPFVGAVLIVLVSVIGVVLVWLWFSGFLGKSLSTTGVGGEFLKIEGGNLSNVGGGVRLFIWVRNLGGGTSLPRTVYIFREGSAVPICIADGLPWAVGAGRLEYFDLWFPIGYVDCAGGVCRTCSEAVSPGVFYVVKLVAAGGAEFSAVLSAH
jgi:hypothetical protein